MITPADIRFDPFERERMLVVAGRALCPNVVEELRGCYPALAVSECDSYMSAIAELANRPPRAVIACVDPALDQLSAAVAGLREAAGPKTRLVLACKPETEAIARQVAPHGADDYVLYPFERHELDTAIVYGRPEPSQSAISDASTEELLQLGNALSSIGGRPMVLLESLAELVRTALKASGATIVIEGAAATVGDPVVSPVLSVPLNMRDGRIGQLMLSKRVGAPYSAADTERLTHYASIAGLVLDAASKQRQWRELAVTDECSGLPNRRYLYERLAEILARAAAEHLPMTILLFDIDNFKTYNDEFGHDAGDEIIRMTGELFRKHCREQDVVARYGGDEFAVAFWDPQGPRTAGSKHPDCALSVLRRFTEALESQEFTCLGKTGRGHLTISGGLATYPWDGRDAETLLRQADQALLAAKRAGKNRIYLIGEADRTA